MHIAASTPAKDYICILRKYFKCYYYKLTQHTVHQTRNFFNLHLYRLYPFSTNHMLSKLWRCSSTFRILLLVVATLLNKNTHLHVCIHYSYSANIVINYLSST